MNYFMKQNFRFGQRLLGFFSILRKYPTFEGGSFIFSWEKQNKISLHCIVRTKKLLHINLTEKNPVHFLLKGVLFWVKIG